MGEIELQDLRARCRLIKLLLKLPIFSFLVFRMLLCSVLCVQSRSANKRERENRNYSGGLDDTNNARACAPNGVVAFLRPYGYGIKNQFMCCVTKTFYVFP